MSHSCSGFVLCFDRHDVLRDMIDIDVLCDIIDIASLYARFNCGRVALSYENGSDCECVEVIEV